MATRPEASTPNTNAVGPTRLNRIIPAEHEHKSMSAKGEKRTSVSQIGLMNDSDTDDVVGGSFENETRRHRVESANRINRISDKKFLSKNRFYLSICLGKG